MDHTKTWSRKSRACRSFLCIMDSLLSIIVFSPIVVGYWRGCWQLMDLYLFEENKNFSMWASLLIGLSSGIIFGLMQDCLNSMLCKRGGYFPFLIVSRIYTILFCICCVNHWRGVWMAWDQYTGITWESGAASTGIGLLILGLTRGIKNILAPPFVAVPDFRENYFSISTLFNTKRQQCGLYVLDLIFTVVVTGSLVVFVWRGSWVFLDRKLFPSNQTYSSWGSLVIGLTVTVVVFFGQIPMAFWTKRLKKGVAKILIEDFYHTFCFVGAVNIWRGVWNLFNIYLYPENPALSNSITTIGGNLILILFFCANSTIPIRGADLDGSKEGHRGIIFRTYYLRSFFKHKIKEPTRRYGFLDKDKRISVEPTGYIDVSKRNGLMDSNSYSETFGSELDGEQQKRLINVRMNPSQDNFTQNQKESSM